MGGCRNAMLLAGKSLKTVSVIRKEYLSSSSGFINPEGTCGGSIDPRVPIKGSNTRIDKSETERFRRKIFDKGILFKA